MSKFEYSPEILEIAKRYGREPSEVLEVRSLPPSELKKLCEQYAIECHQSPAYWRLQPAQDLAAPFLIEIVAREDAFRPNPCAGNSFESPGYRALSFLRDGIHESLKPILLKWLDSGTQGILTRISSHLVAFGSDDLLPKVKVLFEHEYEFVNSGARLGALKAIKEGRCGPKFKAYVWEHCVALLKSSKPPQGYDPIRLLEIIDPEATVTLLSSQDILQKDHTLLPKILSTLRKLGSPAHPQFLLHVLESVEYENKNHGDRVRNAAIFSLIAQGHPEASSYVEGILKNPGKHSESMRLSAWEARFKIRGIRAAYEEAFEAFEKSNYELDPIPKEFRGMILMHYLDAEVQNGGLWQWYFNSFGIHAEETRLALEKVGAKKHAEIIAKANSLFGQNGPAKNVEELREQLDEMSEENAATRDSLDSKLCSLPSWLLYASAWDWKQKTRMKS